MRLLVEQRAAEVAHEHVQLLGRGHRLWRDEAARAGEALPRALVLRARGGLVRVEAPLRRAARLGGARPRQPVRLNVDVRLGGEARLEPLLVVSAPCPAWDSNLPC